MTVIGKCRLCLREGAELQDSHFLSKGVYKILRAEVKEKRNPNPFQITSEGVVQTSKQIKAPLLCRECELRLSKNGEDWVIRNGFKSNGTFRLGAALARSSHIQDADGSTRAYQAASIPAIDISALAYFAASMFWRGSIHPWNIDGTRPVQLGPYEEGLRLYLMGQASFPLDVVLSVTVRWPSNISHFTHTPIGEWRGLLFVAKFPMPGLAFGLTAGPNIPRELRRICFVRGEGNPIFLSKLLEPEIMADGIKMMRSISQKGEASRNI